MNNKFGYEDGIMLCVKIKCMKLILNEAKKMADRAELNLKGTLNPKFNLYGDLVKIDELLNKLELKIVKAMEKCK